MPQSSQNEVFSHASAESSQSESAAIGFIIEQIISKIQTITLVRVTKVTNSGGVSPVGFVDIVPLVHQLTGDRKTVPHSTIYNVPYFRLQGGGDAIILDPKVGDIGMCGFCSRDISSVKKNKKASAPPSLRRFDFSDGLYFGGFLNGTPTQYMQFSADGITVFSPTKITLEAPNIDIKGAVSQSGGEVNVATTLNAGVDVTFAGISGKDHVHGGVEHGGQNTDPPVGGE
jgi:hypothetical protein